MLVRFVLDQDATHDPSAGAAVLVHRANELMQLWIQAGVLTVEKGCDLSRYAEARRFPSSTRDRWRHLMQRLPVLECETGWDGQVSSSALPHLRDQADVAFVDDTSCELDLGLAESERCRPAETPDGVEICRYSTSSSSERFRLALSIGNTAIEAGQSVVDVWNERFARLARYCGQHIVVVDRYAVKDFLRADVGQPSGLHRFFRSIQMDARSKKSLVIYSEWSPEIRNRGVDAAIKEIDTFLRGIQCPLISKVDIVLATTHAFGQISHDRYIRFGTHVWEIGPGIEVLEGAWVRRKAHATLKSCLELDTYRAAESALLTAAGSVRRLSYPLISS